MYMWLDLKHPKSKFAHDVYLTLFQERDPRAFQLFLHLESGATFLGSTPELLYQRSGQCVASEAVAGTRPRGPPGWKP